MKNNLLNKKFGKLTVISQAESKKGRVMWLCQCECGNKTIVRSSHLTGGLIVSCGCYRSEIGKNNKTHGMSKTRLYNIWTCMIARCFNNKNNKYYRYGGRGITVCDEWKNDFQAFYDWAMSNGYANDLTIDRINNDGNYEPSNCRWATAKEQANNTSKNHNVEINGETHTVAEWEDISGISQKTLLSRLKRNKRLDGFVKGVKK